MFYVDEAGKRKYTLKVRAFFCSTQAGHTGSRCVASAVSLRAQKETPDGKPTVSAHPARFSPDDKFSKHRLICKRRFGLLPTQNPQTPL